MLSTSKIKVESNKVGIKRILIRRTSFFNSYNSTSFTCGQLAALMICHA